MQKIEYDDSYLIILLSDPDKPEEKALFEHFACNDGNIFTDLHDCWSEGDLEHQTTPFNFVLIDQERIYDNEELVENCTDILKKCIEKSGKRNIAIFSHLGSNEKWGVPGDGLSEITNELRKDENIKEIAPPKHFSHGSGFDCWFDKLGNGLQSFLKTLEKIAKEQQNDESIKEMFQILLSHFKNKQKMAFEIRHYLLSSLTLNVLNKQNYDNNNFWDKEKVIVNRFCELFPNESENIKQEYEKCRNNTDDVNIHDAICAFALYLENLIRVN